MTREELGPSRDAASPMSSRLAGGLLGLLLVASLGLGIWSSVRAKRAEEAAHRAMRERAQATGALAEQWAAREEALRRAIDDHAAQQGTVWRSELAESDRVASEARKKVEGHLGDMQKRIDALEREHEHFAPREEIEAVRALARASAEHLAAQDARSKSLRAVHDHYKRGVGLVYGRWTLGVEGEKGFEPIKNARGEALDVTFTGTGFLAREDGVVVTNRHVAEPWWENREIEPMLARGVEPRFLKLTITFPERDPLEIDVSTIVTSARGVDIAAFRIPRDDLPVLPLSLPDPDLYRGSRVVVLGYPTGVNAMMARIERSEAREVLARANTMSEVLAELAKRHLISPIVTQGNLTDVRERRLIHDAATTSGGSGGPVFAPDGAVLGVNFAVTRDFGGSNFCVPAEYVRELLTRVPFQVSK